MIVGGPRGAIGSDGGPSMFAHALVPVTYVKAGTDANAAAAVAETTALYTGDGTTSLLNIVIRNGAVAWTANATNYASFVIAVYDSGGGVTATITLTTQPVNGIGGLGSAAAGQTIDGNALIPDGGIGTTPIPLGGYVTFTQTKNGAGVVLGPYFVDLFIGAT